MMNQRTNEGAELLRCAQLNFDNLERAIPFIKTDPFYRIARFQLDEGLRALDGEAPQQIPLTEKERALLLGLRVEG